MGKTIRVSVNEDVERLLDAMKFQYPALDHAEILKLGLSELYWKHELETRQNWIDSLPELELTNAERNELTEALNEADEATRIGKTKSMTVDELIEHLNN